MKYLGLNEIREKYLQFFEGKEHLRLKSFPLVPENDNSLLLINSGMAPMKAFFTGQEIPPSKRVTTCQKCIRTGDIENVGKTARHGTFFEMLGNFSFGDYFKEEIIPWSWEFLTQVMEIPEDRLYVSVFETDDESLKIWNEKVGVPIEKIFKMGKEDNFWEHGVGPCGPCSEIYFDKGKEYGCDNENCTVGCECDRYIEIWNLVFTQYEKTDAGEYLDLAFPNIDTGMGLERLASTMQNVNSIFDIDTIKEIRDSICKLAKYNYGDDAKKDISIRVITDHIRSVCFMTADGVLPSNEGRGYVLRRLLRRAGIHGKLLGINEMFLAKTAKIVAKVSGEAYPELIEKQDYILKVLNVEENRFYITIDQGLSMVSDHIKRIKDEGATMTLVGSEAFRMYDTFGFPLELLQEILEKEGITINTDEFYKEMQAQKERARSAREESTYMGADETIFSSIDPEIATEFVGYKQAETKGKILYIIKNNEIVESAKKGDNVALILDKTVFYAESGGQAGDSGTIKTANAVVEIKDCKKVGGNKFAHFGVVIEDDIKTNDDVTSAYNKVNRLDAARNHSATHLLQKALKDVLGSHIEQAGSNVNKERLRFDFTHFSPLTKQNLNKIEKLVNQKILECVNISTLEAEINEAKKMGATALFGEKYGDTVRVVNMGDYSIELCGGTHVNNSSVISTFKIISETGVAGGVRRIEAITGRAAMEYYKNNATTIEHIQNVVRDSPENIVNKITQFIERAKELDKELQKMQEKSSVGILDEILNGKDLVEGKILIARKFKDLDINALKSISDKVKEKEKSVITVFISEQDNKLNLVTMVTEDLVKEGVHAGLIMKEISSVVGGKGGGRPNMAQGGGTDVDKAEEALAKAKDVVLAQLKK
ncbi:MAG: alanine--tRNA ligase [Lachnospirales bacterium]